MRDPALRKAYRAFRGSVVTLPALEASFTSALHAAGEDADEPGSLLHDYVLESLATLHETAAEGLSALDRMWERVAPDVDRVDAEIASTSDRVPDPDLRRVVLEILHRTGGVSGLMSGLRGSYTRRVDLYGRVLAKARNRPFSGELRDELENHLGPFTDLRQRERRKAEWLQRFQEESDRAVEEGRVGPAGLWPWATDSAVVREACAEDPRLAIELGWLCTETRDSVLLCIVRPLICLVVIVVLLATEGTAE